MRKSAPIIIKGKIQGFKKCQVCSESELSDCLCKHIGAFKLEMVEPAPRLEE